MVIAPLCLVLSWRQRTWPHQWLRTGLAQGDVQRTDSRGRKAGFILSSVECVCVWVGGTEAIFQLRRHWLKFGRGRLSGKAEGKQKCNLVKTAVTQHKGTRRSQRWASASITPTDRRLLSLWPHQGETGGIGGLRQRSVADPPAFWWALCGLARRDACVDGCRWPHNDSQWRMDTVVGLNGTSPLFMRRDSVASSQRRVWK